MSVRIQFQNVGMTFYTDQGALQVVDGVSFDIHDGEFIGIVGPSGCGKTTLMNMLAGFVKPTTGHVLLDGRSIEGPGRDRGVIFQEYGVFPWLTIEENIMFGLQLNASQSASKDKKSICNKYLQLMGLQDFAHSYPKTLSGGMRQRLAIARAYATQPQLLLMDEPFGALDAQTRTKMQNLLLDVLQQEGKTVMMITHSVDEAIYLASKIVVVTARPSRIKEIIEVPFGYPRSESLHDDSRFISLKARLRELVMAEYEAQQMLSAPTHS